MVSVVIPCYNSEKTIKRALLSVAQQSYKDYDVVIVDDGSVDDTKIVVEDFFNGLDMLYQYIYQENAGPSAARNRGVKNSSGEYIAFLDSDDEWHPRKLEIQLAIMREKKLNFLGSRYQYDAFDDSKKIVKLQSYTFNSLLIKNKYSTPGIMMKKVFFQNLGGFDESLHYAEDYDLWLQAAYKRDLYMIESPKLVRLYKEAYGENGLSAAMYSMFKGELYLAKKLFLSKKINCFLYGALVVYMSAKFVRRLVIVRFRKKEV